VSVRPAPKQRLLRPQDDSESEGEGDLFRPRRTESAERPAAGGHALDAADASGLASEVDQLRVWEEPQAQESLRDRFVTGMATPLTATWRVGCVQWLCRASP